MRRQQYGLKAGFWNVDGFSEEKASDDLLQDEIRKYDILFLGETWQHKYNLNSLHYPLGYFHDFVYKNNFNKKRRPSCGILVYYRLKFQGRVSVYDKTSENIFWIEIDKGVNDYENEIL